jgi:hypothetical protein
VWERVEPCTNLTFLLCCPGNAALLHPSSFLAPIALAIPWIACTDIPILEANPPAVACSDHVDCYTNGHYELGTQCRDGVCLCPGWPEEGHKGRYRALHVHTATTEMISEMVRSKAPDCDGS